MQSLRSRLEFLGLDEYSTRFEQEGFDTWETVLAITEPDLYVGSVISAGLYLTLLQGSPRSEDRSSKSMSHRFRSTEITVLVLT